MCDVFCCRIQAPLMPPWVPTKTRLESNFCRLDRGFFFVFCFLFVGLQAGMAIEPFGMNQMVVACMQQRRAAIVDCGASKCVCVCVCSPSPLYLSRSRSFSLALFASPSPLSVSLYVVYVVCGVLLSPPLPWRRADMMPRPQVRQPPSWRSAPTTA